MRQKAVSNIGKNKNTEENQVEKENRSFTPTPPPSVCLCARVFVAGGRSRGSPFYFHWRKKQEEEEEQGEEIEPTAMQKKKQKEEADGPVEVSPSLDLRFYRHPQWYAFFNQILHNLMEKVDSFNSFCEIFKRLFSSHHVYSDVTDETWSVLLDTNETSQSETKT